MSDNKKQTEKQTENKNKPVDKKTIELKKLKEEIKILKEKNSNLEFKISDLELENEKNIIDFQAKAKTFQTKAQEEINKFKDNFKNQSLEQEIELKKYAPQKFVESFGDIILNFELAISVGSKQEDPGVSAYVQGFNMLMDQFMNVLESNGVTKIVPKIGDKYNPELHEVFSSGDNKSKLIEIKKPGFKIHDRVIKPASVVID